MWWRAWYVCIYIYIYIYSCKRLEAEARVPLLVICFSDTVLIQDEWGNHSRWTSLDDHHDGLVFTGS